MRKRLLLSAAMLAAALAVEAQQEIFKIELTLGGAMYSLNTPTQKNGTYTFAAWPDGAPTTLQASSVKRMTRLTGNEAATVYKIDLVPSGNIIAKDAPALKNGAYVFHAFRGGALTSIRKSDVRKISAVTGEQAFWIEQGQTGEAAIGNFAMEGTGQVVSIGRPDVGGSTQAGPRSASSVNGSGISGAPVYGNWQYQGTPGVSDAYAPANATMNNGVPTMPAATNGGAPPQ